MLSTSTPRGGGRARGGVLGRAAEVSRCPVKIAETRLDDIRSSDIEEPPQMQLSDEVPSGGSQGLGLASACMA